MRHLFSNEKYASFAEGGSQIFFPKDDLFRSIGIFKLHTEMFFSEIQDYMAENLTSGHGFYSYLRSKMVLQGETELQIETRATEDLTLSAELGYPNALLELFSLRAVEQSPITEDIGDLLERAAEQKPFAANIKQIVHMIYKDGFDNDYGLIDQVIWMAKLGHLESIKFLANEETLNRVSSAYKGKILSSICSFAQVVCDCNATDDLIY